MAADSSAPGPPPAAGSPNTDSPAKIADGVAHRYQVEEVNRALTGAMGRPERVLDVGCGIGLNGAVARRRGAHVTGIEPAAWAREQARQRLDEVLDIDITDERALLDALGDRRFDVILLGDVLEHLPAPERPLASLVRLLDDGGHLLVSLPNVAAWTVRLALLAGRWDYRPSGILDSSHLRFFTLESARQLLQDSGLELLYHTHNPMLLRAAKPLIARLYPEAQRTGDPTALSRTLSYQLYQALLQPTEAALVNLAPELLAFQHVLVARKPPARRQLSLTVGMLTMDEEQSAARMIGEIRAVAPDAQILCVDSSTHDRTPEIARRLGARVLRQVPPRGHGPAMELLMYAAAAQSELLIYLDCDFTYPPAYIPRLRTLVEEQGADVVNCARTRTRPAAMPWPNFLANRSFAAMAHVAHGVPTVDVHSGMRAFRSSVIRAFDFDGEGDAIPIDTLLYPAKCGYHVVEMPISYDERVGASKLRKLAGAAWSLVRLGRALGVGERGAPRFELR